MNLKKLACLGLAMMVTLGALGCGSDGADKNSSTLAGSITGSGSSALLPLAKDAAAKFKALHPNVSITLNGGGSGTGLKQVADGSVMIGNSDVPAESKLSPEIAKTLVDHKVCVVAMAPVINRELSDKVSSLSKKQLQDIFTAKITNWKQIGGPDEEIVLITRPATSGTRALFQEFALEGAREASNKALETDDSGTLLQSVKDNKGAIGYVALSYLVNNKDVSVVAIDGIKPTLENVYNGKYPVWGYEHMYTKGEDTGAVKEFLDYIVSDEYGKNIEAQGYGVTAKMQVQR